MNTQLNIKLNQEMLNSAEEIALDNGFLNVQEMIRQLIREKLLQREDILFGASMESFGKEWLSDEDEKAWASFQ